MKFLNHTERLADEVTEHTRLVATSLVQMQTGRTADLAAICGAAERAGVSHVTEQDAGANLAVQNGYLTCRT